MDLKNHKRFEYCKNRPKYRAGRNLTAVKAYTVANESKHLFIFGVPKINLQNELKRKLTNFGEHTLKCVTNEIHKISTQTDCEYLNFNLIFSS